MGYKEMIYYLMNENKEIVQDDFTYFENALSIDEANYKIVNGYNGALFFEEYTRTEEYRQKEKEWQTAHQFKELRRRREMECFPVINRGYLWYMQLSDEQLKELNEWYKDWLNVTETLLVPQKPEWME